MRTNMRMEKRLFIDTATNKVYTVEDIGVRFYGSVNRDVYPTVFDFIDSVLDVNGGTLHELTEKEKEDRQKMMEDEAKQHLIVLQKLVKDIRFKRMRDELSEILKELDLLL